MIAQLTAECLTLADQMVLYYGFAHRSIKWWKRVFFHILDTAIVNAHVLFTASSDRKLTQLEFRQEVAEGLLEGYEAAKVRRRAQDPNLPLRLKGRPFPDSRVTRARCVSAVGIARIRTLKTGFSN